MVFGIEKDPPNGTFTWIYYRRVCFYSAEIEEHLTFDEMQTLTLRKFESITENSSMEDYLTLYKFHSLYI